MSIIKSNFQGFEMDNDKTANVSFVVYFQNISSVCFIRKHAYSLLTRKTKILSFEVLQV